MSIHRGFDSLEEMDSSDWLANTAAKMAAGKWPDECSRCQLAEESGLRSIRQSAIDKHVVISDRVPDYLHVNVDIDTLCNAACQYCSPNLSSYYATLAGVNVAQNSGLQLLNSIDPTRVTTLVISGGEASFSPAVQEFLATSIPKFTQLQLLEISTNGSIPMTALEGILQTGVKILLEVSADGTGSIFEYNRFPISWNTFSQNLEYYLRLRDTYPNLNIAFWSTWSALSVVGIQSAIDYTSKYNMQFGGGILVNPPPLRLHNNNFLTRATKDILQDSTHPTIRRLCSALATEQADNSNDLYEFIAASDKLRGMNFNDYYRDFGITI